MKIVRKDGLEYDRKAKDKRFDTSLTLRFERKELDKAKDKAKELDMSFNEFVRLSLESYNKAKDTKLSKRLVSKRLAIRQKIRS